MEDRSSHPNRQVGRGRFSKALANAGQNRVDPAITLGEYKAMAAELDRPPMWSPAHKGTRRNLRPERGGLRANPAAASQSAFQDER